MGKTGTTGKTGQLAWAKRILKLLEQAKAKDPDLVRFGAYSHKYKLSPLVSEETIQKFEALLWALWGEDTGKGTSRFPWFPPLPRSGRAGDLSEDE